MVDIGLDIDDIDVREAFNDLEDQFETDAVWKVSDGTEYGIILEFGRGPVEAQDADALRFEDADGNVIFRQRVSGHPPYPWFRPAIREFRANPRRFIRDNTAFTDVSEIDSANELVRTVALALQKQMEKNASANTATDRSPGTDGDHPQRDTGNLVASIQAKPIR